MELNREVVELLEQRYKEWLDDCELYGLDVKDTSDQAFSFIKNYISNNSNDTEEV